MKNTVSTARHRQATIIAASLFLVSIVTGCLSIDAKEDALDQGAHYSLGYGLSCDLSRWTSPEIAIDTVMAYAVNRESLQHPGVCGPGCKADLASWLLGATAGAGCSTAESSELPQ